MDGNYLQNLLGSAVLGAIRGARNEEQGSFISVPIPTRELFVPQIQDLSSISIQQEHRGAYSMSSQISAVEHRFNSVSTCLSSTSCEDCSPLEPTLMDLDSSPLKGPPASYIAQGSFDIPTVHNLMYTSLCWPKQSAKTESVVDYSFGFPPMQWLSVAPSKDNISVSTLRQVLYH